MDTDTLTETYTVTVTVTETENGPGTVTVSALVQDGRSTGPYIMSDSVPFEGAADKAATAAVLMFVRHWQSYGRMLHPNL